MLINSVMILYLFYLCKFPFEDIRVFHKLDEIGNNASIGIRDFTTWKQIIPVTENVTPVRIESGISDSKPNILLSELTWYLLVRLRL